MEVAKYRGMRTLAAFPACSKSTERVGHTTAGERGVRSGMPVRVAAMAFSIFRGQSYANLGQQPAKSLHT